MLSGRGSSMQSLECRRSGVKCQPVGEGSTRDLDPDTVQPRAGRQIEGSPVGVSKREVGVVLREVGSAHHAAFADTGGDDPQWSEWYAHKLAGPLSRIIGIDLTAPVVAHHLEAVEREQARSAFDSLWPEYYAMWFRGRYAAV